MTNDNTNYTQSVTAVVIKDGKVLLARHTYGPGKGKLIIPGGYVEYGELPQEAVRREFFEETRVLVEPRSIIGMRFNGKEWYLAFLADYKSGIVESDHDENSEVLWMDIEEALVRDDVPNLTKELIRCALKPEKAFEQIPYKSSSGNSMLFGIK